MVDSEGVPLVQSGTKFTMKGKPPSLVLRVSLDGMPNVRQPAVRDGAVCLGWSGGVCLGWSSAGLVNRMSCFY